MAKVIKLHPKVREHHNPRISAAALAEYLIMKPDQQETVLHNSRFSSPPIMIPYQKALSPIRAYCADPARPTIKLDNAKIRLTHEAEDYSIRPRVREESLRCVETIELFQRSQNSFGINKLKLIQPHRFDALDVNGVQVSCQPDLIVQSKDAKGQQLAGMIMFRPQKAPDPQACRLEETKRQRGEHRREMGRYMLAIAELSMAKNGGEYGKFDRVNSMVADIRMQERIEFSTVDNAARVRAIKAACKQINSLWDDIVPRKSVLAKSA